MKKATVLGLFMLLLALSLAALTQTVDFNNTSDLNNYFNTPIEGDVTNVSSAGINNSGSVSMPLVDMSETRIITNKTGFGISQTGEPIIVSAYIKNSFNGGYASIGFSSASSNISSPKCHITNVPAIGVQFFSSGVYFYNNSTELLATEFIPDIPLNSWYNLELTIIPQGGDSYAIIYWIRQSDADGTFNGTIASAAMLINNSTIDDGQIYPYFGIDGHRVTYVDDFFFTAPDDITLPVTMSSFTAVASSETLVNLQWTTESESNILGFNIYRSEEANLAQAIKLNASYIDGTNTSTQHSYNFADGEFDSNTTYYYWVESADMDYSSSFYGPVSVFTGSEGEDTPPTTVEGETGIVNVYPNPFSPNTEIAYKLRNPEIVTIGIYNLKGQLIRSLVKGSKDSGYYLIGWDGKDNNGKDCSNGLYLARMQAGSANSFYKMTLLK